jgi:hypothetical protein
MAYEDKEAGEQISSSQPTTLPTMTLQKAIMKIYPPFW